MAIVPPLTQYFGAIDWNQILPAPWGLVIGGVVMFAMRFLTTTAVMQKD
jgi:hypothetical protein